MENKYGNLFKINPVVRFDHIYPLITADVFRFNGEKDIVGGAKYEMLWLFVEKPFLMIKDAHSHDHDQYLVFMGGDPRNIREFDAEIWLYMGKEQEKHIINTCSAVFIPRDFIHCPLDFKRVDKPVVLMNIALGSEYVRKPLSA